MKAHKASMPRLCRVCHTAQVVGDTSQRPHALATAQFCAACRAARRRRPVARVTEAQAAQLKDLVGVIPQREIEARLGLSQANITRWIRESGHPGGHYNTYPPAVVQAVCAAYSALGKARTQALFPDVALRSIVERHRDLIVPRQVRWTGAHLVEAVRMAGLVSADAQARWFGRPNAYGGSIKSLWIKHLRCSPRDIHGLPASVAWPLVQPGCPATMSPPDNRQPGVRVKVLWLDAAAWLRAEVARECASAVQALARFQGWVWGLTSSHDIRRQIAAREAASMALTVGTNGKTHAPEAPLPAPVADTRVETTEEIFNAKSIVRTLESLMNRVTEQAATPETVTAACQCASQISNLLRVHLEAERLRRLDRR